MVIAGLLLPPVLRVARRLGMALAGLSGLVGASLVCAGINYPLDVLVGTVLGIGIGWAGMTLARLPSPTPALGARRWVGVGSMAVVLLVTGSATTVLIVRGGEHRPPATPGIVAPRISPPNQASAALSSAVAPHTARLEAASDGHMCVAVAYVALPEHASLANVQTTARSAVNATFAAWPQLDLLTVAVQYAVAGRSGTLYTATVERASVPPGGFPPDRALPGAKFFHQRLLSGR
jgi:hypothetical protein